MSKIITESLITEKRNEKTLHLDNMTTLEFVKVMNEEDKKVATSVEDNLHHIANAIDICGEALNKGGRIIYMGAGTSGRIGLLDAVECVPTFGVSQDKVIGLIAGGEMAFVKAVEGAEDNKNLGKEDLINLNITNDDIVIGIAASGRTPYVIGGLIYAKEVLAKTIAISCNKNSEIGSISDINIELIVGPEVLTGSTRLKAGTAQKLVVNMISTGAMVKFNKVYENLMVDVKATNEKLVHRARKIVMECTELNFEESGVYLESADYNVKVCIVMVKNNCTKKEAIDLLIKNNGSIRNSI